MTIDEFMTDIAPKMRPGWVAMSQKGDWWYYPDEPLINTAMGHGIKPALSFQAF